MWTTAKMNLYFLKQHHHKRAQCFLHPADLQALHNRHHASQTTRSANWTIQPTSMKSNPPPPVKLRTSLVSSRRHWAKSWRSTSYVFFFALFTPFYAILLLILKMNMRYLKNEHFCPNPPELVRFWKLDPFPI